MIDYVEKLREKADLLEKSGFATCGLVQDYRNCAVVIEKLSGQQQTDKWIPCSSKILPDEMKEVLISRENSKTGTSVGYYNKVFGWYDQCLLRGVSDVVAWMPKPIEYKKEGNSNENT